jgi:hypothetical protein
MRRVELLVAGIDGAGQTAHWVPVHNVSRS